MMLKRLTLGRCWLPVCLGLMLAPAIAQQNRQPSRMQFVSLPAQNATIGLIAGGPGSTDARIAADIAQVLDDSDKLRVLPMLGRGSVQNIADLIYLKGVDVAIVHTDVLTQTMQSGTIPRERHGAVHRQAVSRRKSTSSPARKSSASTT